MASMARGRYSCGRGTISLSRARAGARMLKTVVVCSFSMAAATTSTTNLVGEESRLKGRAHKGSSVGIWEF